MALDGFTHTLMRVVHEFAKKLAPGAKIVLMMQPTQWHAPERRYTDHVVDLLRHVHLPLLMRISCPYESQQAKAQMVDWAKQAKHVLVLTRELVVWEAPA
jgi:hypothetical protein